jgi:hypothetical protein
MPVKTLAMRRLKGSKRTFYMDEHGGYSHKDVDFYPAELVEKIIEDLSNQVLEERKKWSSLGDYYRTKRKELRASRHATVAAKEKLAKCINLLVSHDLIKDCPYKNAVINFTRGINMAQMSHSLKNKDV